RVLRRKRFATSFFASIVSRSRHRNGKAERAFAFRLRPTAGRRIANGCFTAFASHSRSGVPEQSRNKKSGTNTRDGRFFLRDFPSVRQAGSLGQISAPQRHLSFGGGSFRTTTRVGSLVPAPSAVTSLSRCEYPEAGSKCVIEPGPVGTG